MEFWKEHQTLRFVLITVLFVLGMAMVIGGWKMTGQLNGLLLMLVGVVVLLAALAIYNKPYEDPKPKKK